MFKFGIIGAGGIAERFCRAIKNTDCGEVIAVSSKSEDRAKAFAEKNGVPSYYDDYEQMLLEAKPDAVYIATTHNFHYENIMLCLKYNIPVLCEKPMVITKAQAEEVFKVSREKNVFVMEAMWSHLLPCNIKAKELIARGEIGDVVSAEYTFGFNAGEGHRVFNPDIAGGAIFDVGVYAIEGLMDLINKPVDEVIPSVTFNNDGVDTVDRVVLRFGDCLAQAHSTILSNCVNDAIVYGTKGRIHLEKAFECRKFTVHYNDGSEKVYEVDFKDGFEFEIEETVRCIKEGKYESKFVPHSETLKCAEIFDICLKR